MTDQSSIRSILATLTADDDESEAFLMAAAFNLYAEAMRRVRGRALLGPSDIRNVFSICQLLLQKDPPAQVQTFAHARSRELTEEEKAHLLAVEEGVRRL